MEVSELDWMLCGHCAQPVYENDMTAERGHDDGYDCDYALHAACAEEMRGQTVWNERDQEALFLDEREGLPLG